MITLVNDTFTANSAIGGAGGSGRHSGGTGSGFGGAVFAVNGTVTATFVTFSANTAQDGASNALDGTDVYVLATMSLPGSGSVVTLTDDILGQATSLTSDFVANYFNAPAGPGMYGQNDLISNNSPSTTAEPNSTGFTGAVPITGDPKLGPLANNGGPTETMALLAGSPAISAGVAVEGITTDQRGVARVFTPDIGAYEYSVPTITVSPSSLSLGITTAGTPGTDESYTISGLDLTETLTVTAPTGVEISDDGGTTWTTSLSFIPSSGIVTSKTIETRLSASAAVGPVSGTITNTSTGAPEEDVSVTGTVDAGASPTVSISPTSLDLGTTTTGTAGTNSSYTVSGMDLTSNLAITAPASTEISDDGGQTWHASLTLDETEGIVASTTILVRLCSSAPAGSVIATITNTSTGAPEEDVSVSGTVKSSSNAGDVVASTPQTFYGENVNFIATFSATSNNGLPMTGTVAFYSGSTYLGTEPFIASGPAALSSARPESPAGAMASGTSTLPTSSLPVGQSVIMAIYSGDANYSSATSQTPVSVVVVPTVTSTKLTSTTNTQGTTLFATVVVTSPGDPSVDGSVSFYDGTTLLGTEPVVDGVATYFAGVLTGSHSFTAVYSGGGSSSGSSGAVVVSTDGPQVTGVDRYGYHMQPTYVLISFDGPLAVGPAEDVANYQIVGPGGCQITCQFSDLRCGDEHGHFGAGQRLNLHWKYQLDDQWHNGIGIDQSGWNAAGRRGHGPAWQ